MQTSIVRPNEEIYSDAESTANLEWFMSQWGSLQVPSGQNFVDLSNKLNHSECEHKIWNTTGADSKDRWSIQSCFMDSRSLVLLKHLQEEHHSRQLRFKSLVNVLVRFEGRGSGEDESVAALNNPPSLLIIPCSAQ